MSPADRPPHVLIVDDEEAVADVYALLLEEYQTTVAYGGEAALEAVDDDVDVVLLDRRMPDRAGDEVLDRIRGREIDCRVIMLTAVDPDFDILEMPFDDYLCKPVEKEELTGAIERQIDVMTYDDRVGEFFELSSKLALLEREKPPADLEAEEDVARLRERAERLGQELDGHLDDVSDFDQAFRSLSRL